MVACCNNVAIVNGCEQVSHRKPKWWDGMAVVCDMREVRRLGRQKRYDLQTRCQL